MTCLVYGLRDDWVKLLHHFARFFVRGAVVFVVLEALVARHNDKAKRYGFTLQVDVGFQIKCRGEADKAKVHHRTALVDAHRIAIEEKEFFVDVLEAVFFVVNGPFGIAVIFLTVGAAVIIDIAFEACAFLIALVPFAAKGARLHAGTTIALFVQLVIDDHVVHLHVLDLIVDIHEDDVSFDILRALAGEIHIFVRLQKRLLQFNVDSIRNFTLLDFVKRFLRRHMDNLVTLLDGVTELVAHIVQALLHVNMDRIGTCRNEVRTDAHVPFVSSIPSISLLMALPKLQKFGFRRSTSAKALSPSNAGKRESLRAFFSCNSSE